MIHSWWYILFLVCGRNKMRRTFSSSDQSMKHNQRISLDFSKLLRLGRFLGLFQFLSQICLRMFKSKTKIQSCWEYSLLWLFCCRPKSASVSLMVKYKMLWMFLFFVLLTIKSYIFTNFMKQYVCSYLCSCADVNQNLKSYNGILRVQEDDCL